MEGVAAYLGESRGCRLRVLLALSVFFFASIAFNWVAWETVWKRWSELGSYEHGIPVLVLTGLLLHRVVLSNPADHRGRSILSVTLLMLGILVLSFATNIFGRLSIELAAVGLLPIILLFGLALIGGSRRQNARVYVVPLFLYTALPVWDQFSVALQMLTVSVVAFVLQQLGVLALVDGTYVHLRQGVFEIAQGCSGLRFFLTAAAMTIFWTTYQRCLPLRTIAAVLIALSISIVTNWLRVVIIVLTGNSFGMDALVVTSHYFLGWGLFLATLIAAWSIMDRFGLFEPGPDSGRG